MNVMAKSRAVIAIAVVSIGTAISGAQSMSGRWDATVTIDGNAIPFRLDISGDEKDLTGTLYNGTDKETTTSAKLENGAAVLYFDH